MFPDNVQSGCPAFDVSGENSAMLQCGVQFSLHSNSLLAAAARVLSTPTANRRKTSSKAARPGCFLRIARKDGQTV